ncbi:MAG: DUF1963 domain-containing protein [Bacillota bacterium]|nr:DUF1963 domain-containing protein [Bacillota bacterium]
MLNKNDFTKKIEKYKRKVWIPKIVNEEISLTTSKFLGTPVITDSFNWPICPNCGKKMQFFMQLNVLELPDEFKSFLGIEEGLIQLFYCTTMESPIGFDFSKGSPNFCDIDCETYFPFSKSIHARVIKDFNLTTSNNFDTQSISQAKTIVAWEEKYDLPGIPDLESLGVEVNEEVIDLIYESGYPLVGDKIGGWPLWFQNSDYPTCPICKKKMRYLVQLDSEGNIPYVFGEYGVGLLTQCEEHKEILTFHWNCM